MKHRLKVCALLLLFSVISCAGYGMDCSQALNALALAQSDTSGRLCYVCVRDTLDAIAARPNLDIERTRVLLIRVSGFSPDLVAQHTNDEFMREWNYHFVVTYDDLVIDPEFGRVRQLVDLETYFTFMYPNQLDRIQIKEWTGPQYRQKWVWLAGLLNNHPLSPSYYIGFVSVRQYLDTHPARMDSSGVIVVADDGIDDRPRTLRELTPMEIRAMMPR
jgi:hypothetical protein